MTDLLVTGFTPFDGRRVNASWIAAKSQHQHRTLEIPVLWSAPAQCLSALCNDNCPELIISMGEGREGWFDIETVARNSRKERSDNAGAMPEGKPILPDGPEVINAGIDAGALQRNLAQQGYPIRISSDAGGFLCEETLYTLEHLKAKHARLSTVVFVHLPPYGTTFFRRGVEVQCKETELESFATALVAAALAMHARSVNIAT